MTIRKFLGRAMLVLVGIGVIVAGFLWWYLRPPPIPEPGTLTVTGGAGTYEVGGFRISLIDGPAAQFRVWHKDRPSVDIWSSLPGRAFIGLFSGEMGYTGGHSFRLKIKTDFECRDQTVEWIGNREIEVASENGDIIFRHKRFLIEGFMQCPHGREQYEIDLSAGAKRLYASPQFKRQTTVPGDREYTRIFNTQIAGEVIFGFGAQFSRFDMKGRRLPVFVSEQGIGRGRQPQTFLANIFGNNAGGSWYHSYAPSNAFVTTSGRGFSLELARSAVFDFRHKDYFVVESNSRALQPWFSSGETPLHVIDANTGTLGYRMEPLPEWIHRGAILGIQGGTETVRRKVQAAQDAGVPIAAVWLQDWVGQRKTSFGKQLWWNWELDRNHYPGWDHLVADLKAQNIRVMTYVNPYLVDTAEIGDGRRNLFAEAKAKGFLVKNASGKPYMLRNTSFDYAIVDLRNIEANKWFTDIIITNVIDAGASGWMADFGESYPFDAAHFDFRAYVNRQAGAKDGYKSEYTQQDADFFHNGFPEDWAYTNLRAVLGPGKQDEIVFFMRSASPNLRRATPLMWLGDQMVTWDEHDGLKTVVTGLTSSGVSGFAYNHSDIGGYTALDYPFLKHVRTQELFMRWAELAAFTPVFRTHEGNRPDLNHQFDSAPETLAHFAKMARLYTCLAPHRIRLSEEVTRTGSPLVRHPLLHYPEDERFKKMTYQQFLLGKEIMVVPAQDPGINSVTAYLPPGEWIHLWTGKTYGPGEHEVPAPIGEPPAFIAESAPVLTELQACGFVPKAN